MRGNDIAPRPDTGRLFSRQYSRKELEAELRMCGKEMSVWLREMRDEGRLLWVMIHPDPKSVRRQRRYVFIAKQLPIRFH